MVFVGLIRYVRSTEEAVVRVVIITPQFPDTPETPTGGVGAATAALARGLLKARPGTEVHVVHTNPSESHGARPWGDFDVSLHRVALPKRLTRMPVRQLIQRAVHKVVDAIRPDVVHVQASASLIDPARYPSVLTIHGIPGKDAAFRGRSALATYRDQAQLDAYPHLIAIAGHVLQELQHKVDGRWHFVPNAIHPRFFDVRADPGVTEPVVLQVGSIIRRKNPGATIEAIGLLRDRGVEAHLRLAGPRLEEGYAKELDMMVERLGLQDRVHWLGSVPQDELVGELARARVVALPSFQETAPMVIGEAGAAGVACVVAPAGGAAEMLLDGYSGALCDARSAESVADALQRPLMDAEVARLWGQRARDGADRYHSTSVAQATARVYDIVMG
jgi:glycosyltransferase involved in cell wall biosynthesis